MKHASIDFEVEGSHTKILCCPPPGTADRLHIKDLEVADRPDIKMLLRAYLGKIFLTDLWYGTFPLLTAERFVESPLEPALWTPKKRVVASPLWCIFHGALTSYSVNGYPCHVAWYSAALAFVHWRSWVLTLERVYADFLIHIKSLDFPGGCPWKACIFAQEPVFWNLFWVVTIVDYKDTCVTDISRISNCKTAC